MGVLSFDEMGGLERDGNYCSFVDWTIRLAFWIQSYNSHAGCEHREMSVEGFQALCEVLQLLAGVDDAMSSLLDDEDTPAFMRTTLENVEYVAMELCDEFGVGELCKLPNASRDFWFAPATDDDLYAGYIMFGGKQRRPAFPAKSGEFLREPVRLFEEAAIFSQIDDTELLDHIAEVLKLWKEHRTSSRQFEIHTDAGRESSRQSTVLVPTPLQSAILGALENKALKKQALADIVSKGEGSRLYRRGGLKELIKLGKVKHARGRGYFRPDAPPVDAEVIAPPEERD